MWLVTHGCYADVSQHLQQNTTAIATEVTNIFKASPYQLTNLHTYDKMQINFEPR